MPDTEQLERAVEGEPAGLPMLERVCLLPPLKAWKAESSRASYQRRPQALKDLDQWLEAFWVALGEARKQKGTQRKPGSGMGMSREAVEFALVHGNKSDVWRGLAMSALQRVVRFGLDYVAAEAKVDRAMLMTMFRDSTQAPKAPAPGDERRRQAALMGERYMREKLEALPAKGSAERVPPTVALIWTAFKEFRRYERSWPQTTGDWQSEPPPVANVLEAWSGLSFMPTLDVWRAESSGGSNRRWTRRGASDVALIDAHVAAFFRSLRRLHKTQALAELKDLIAAARAYIRRKKAATGSSVDPEIAADRRSRLIAVKRLRARAEAEKTRLEQGWTGLMVPRVPGFGARLKPGEEVDVFASGAAFMELRVLLPTPKRWVKASNFWGRRGKLKSYVDKRLERFWLAFLSSKSNVGGFSRKAMSVLELSSLVSGCRCYLSEAERNATPSATEEPTADSEAGDFKTRVAAVRWLCGVAEAEVERLGRDWPEAPDKALPPLVGDLRPDEEEAEAPDPALTEATAQLAATSGELDPAGGLPVDAATLGATLAYEPTAADAPYWPVGVFFSATNYVGQSLGLVGPTIDKNDGFYKPEDEQTGAHLSTMNKAMTDKSSPYFGREQSWACVTQNPQEAARRIIEKRTFGQKKWVRRQLAQIQACSVINYPSAVMKGLTKQGKSDEIKREYAEFFVDVVSVCDYVSRTMYQGYHSKLDRRASAWGVLRQLGFKDEHPDLVLPLSSISGLLFACKYRDGSLTGMAMIGLEEYGKKQAIATVSSILLSVGCAAESAAGANAISTGLGQTAATATAAANPGLSVFGAASAGLTLPLNAVTIGRALKQHRGLTNMRERLEALQTAMPEVARLIEISPFFYRLRVALLGKLGRRKTRAKAQIAAASVSTASTIVGVTLTIAAANAWNPLGWTLAGLAGVGTVGLIGYSIYRRMGQQSALAELRLQYNIPPFVLTAGEWDRYCMADLMYRAAIHDQSMQKELMCIGYALLFVVFGGSLQEARHAALSMGHAGIMSFIKG